MFLGKYSELSDVFVGIGASFLTWRFVENPIRKLREDVNRARGIASGIFGIIYERSLPGPIVEAVERDIIECKREVIEATCTIEISKYEQGGLEVMQDTHEVIQCLEPFKDEDGKAEAHSGDEFPWTLQIFGCGDLAWSRNGPAKGCQLSPDGKILRYKFSAKKQDRIPRRGMWRKKFCGYLMSNLVLKDGANKLTVIVRVPDAMCPIESTGSSGDDSKCCPLEVFFVGRGPVKPDPTFDGRHRIFTYGPKGAFLPGQGFSYYWSGPVPAALKCPERPTAAAQGTSEQMFGEPDVNGTAAQM
jgi:hypothetical protein